MKKLSLIGVSVLLAFTGCGRGWLPCLHRGASCMSGSRAPAYAPMATASSDCVGCGGGGYETRYEGQEGFVSEGPSVIGQYERILPGTGTPSPTVGGPR